MTPLLQIDGLQTGYGDLRVVWDFSISVRSGEVAVLLGRNGAGKTTTLRAIAGLNKATAGTVSFDGADITGAAPHARVGRGMAYVQEGKRVFHALTVEQNLLVGGRLLKVRRAELLEQVDRVYDLFPPLRDKRSAAAGSMSGGQQQMLSIGQALMSRPKVLLLDEPSGGLAPVIVKEVMDQVRGLAADGLGVLLVEQAVEAAFAVADHVSVLDMGRVTLAAEASDIDNVAVLQDAYFGRHQDLD